MFDSILKPLVVVMTLIIVAPVSAQQVHSYKFVPRTVLEKKPVKVTRYVDETVMEKQSVTAYKKVYQTETRERRRTEYKPVRKTSEREERTVVRKPVVETKYREKKTTETSYETVTEMRDQQYTVREPVIETRMREETVTVKKPVTEQLIEVQRTTTFKPVLKTQTDNVPTGVVMQELGAIPDPTQRPRMQLLPAGNYTDPATGQTVYRRRGLHWVQPSVIVPVATNVPQETNPWTFEPEVTETRKPVEFTRFVEQTETRQIPVEVERTVERMETRKVPVTVQIPKTTTVVEEIPYTETVYREEVIVKKVPYTETTYEKVEIVESYTVEVPRWIEETSEQEVPRTVRKRVEYEDMRDVPRTVMFKIPLDDCGNEIGPAVLAYPELEPALTGASPAGTSSQASEPTSAESTTTVRRIDTPPTDTGKSIMEDGNASEDSETEGYSGELSLVPEKTLDETSLRKSSIDVPDTSEESKTELSRIPGSKDVDANPAAETESKSVDPPSMPEVQPSGSGDEGAADRLRVPTEAGTPPEENSGGQPGSSGAQSNDATA